MPSSPGHNFSCYGTWCTRTRGNFSRFSKGTAQRLFPTQSRSQLGSSQGTFIFSSGGPINRGRGSCASHKKQMLTLPSIHEFVTSAHSTGSHNTTPRPVGRALVATTPIPYNADNIAEDCSIYASLRTGTTPHVALCKHPRCYAIFKGWSVWRLLLAALQFELLAEINLASDKAAVRDLSVELIFLTGTWEDLAFVWEQHYASTKLLAVLDLGSIPNMSSGYWHLVHHSEFDSVTDGEWWGGHFLSFSPHPVCSSTGLKVEPCPVPSSAWTPFHPNRDDTRGQPQLSTVGSRVVLPRRTFPGEMTSCNGVGPFGVYLLDHPTF